MVLIITSKDDVTTDFVVNGLNKIGAEHFRLNTEDLSSRFELSVYIDKEGSSFFVHDTHKTRSLNLSEVSSVYYRRPTLPSTYRESLSFGENQFVAREVTYALEGLYKILRDRFWISSVDSIREAENKIYQLLVAQEIGFAIPKSLMTTSADEARAFFESVSGNCIVKPIRNGMVDDEKNPGVVFTNSLRGRLVNWPEAVSFCPVYLQYHVEKSADIRVTVVGAKSFGARICSQDFPETSIDWRKGGNTNVRHEQIVLPADIEKKCVELVKRLHLNFGAIDLILDKDGRYFFLEINPNGQWAWIEKRLGYDISGAITGLLMEGGQE